MTPNEKKLMLIEMAAQISAADWDGAQVQNYVGWSKAHQNSAARAYGFMHLLRDVDAQVAFNPADLPDHMIGVLEYELFPYRNTQLSYFEYPWPSSEPRAQSVQPLIEFQLQRVGAKKMGLYADYKQSMAVRDVVYSENDRRKNNGERPYSYRFRYDMDGGRKVNKRWEFFTEDVNHFIACIDKAMTPLERGKDYYIVFPRDLNLGDPQPVITEPSDSSAETEKPEASISVSADATFSRLSVFFNNYDYKQRTALLVNVKKQCKEIGVKYKYNPDNHEWTLTPADVAIDMVLLTDIFANETIVYDDETQAYVNDKGKRDKEKKAAVKAEEEDATQRAELAASWLDNWRYYGYEPFAYQRKDIIAAIKRGSMWFQHQPGLGKSLMGTAYIKFMHEYYTSRGQDVVIVLSCPKNMADNWPVYLQDHDVPSSDIVLCTHHYDALPKVYYWIERKEYKGWYNFAHHITDEGMPVSVIDKYDKETEKQFRKTSRDKRYKIVAKDGRTLYDEDAGLTPIIIHVSDEAHAYRYDKSLKKSKRTRSYEDFNAVASYCLPMTGTPMPRGEPVTTIPNLNAVNAKAAQNERAFLERYCGPNTDNFGGRVTWDEAKNLPDYYKAIRECAIRRRFVDEEVKEAIQLKEFKRFFTQITPTADERREYQRTIDNIMRNYRERIRQGKAFAGGEVLVELSAYRRAASLVKVSSTVNYALDVLRAGNSIVIFAEFNESADRITEQLREEHAKQKRAGDIGDVDFFEIRSKGNANRKEIEDSFNKSPNPAVMVCTYTAREGLTLTKATYVVIQDRYWEPAWVMQAEQRIWRKGQENPCISVWPVWSREDADIDTVILNRAYHQQIAIDDDVKSIQRQKLSAAIVAKNATLAQDEQAMLMDAFMRTKSLQTTNSDADDAPTYQQSAAERLMQETLDEMTALNNAAWNDDDE